MDCQKETMLTFDTLKCELAKHNLRKVARETELHYNTVYRFMNTEKDPKYSTMKALSDYVEGVL
jgi:DNA-binding phage protein